MDVAQFHAERAKGIGSSDAAAVCGVSPWCTPFELWAEKRALIDGKEPIRKQDERDRLRLEFGNLFETSIAEYYSKMTGRKIRRRRKAMVSKSHPCMLSHLDRQLFPAKDDPMVKHGMGVLEVKSPSVFSRREWDGGSQLAPLHYQIQMQHHLAVTGYEWGAFAVLIGKDQLVQFDVLRDNEFIDKLVAAEEVFWGLVKSGDEPDVGAYDAAVLSKLYPTDDGEMITLPHEATEWDETRTHAIERLKHYKEVKDEIDNKIKHAMKGALMAFLPADDGKYKWATYTRKQYTVQEQEIRQLRRLKGGRRG
jgi:putative phage-type endonuclease